MLHGHLPSPELTVAPITCISDTNQNTTSEAIAAVISDNGFAVPTSGYDDEDRLVGGNRADSHLDQSWNLSLVGDWNRFTENATMHSRTHGSAPEILTAASQTVAHDAKGNQMGLPSTLTTSTSRLTLDWGFESKLASPSRAQRTMLSSITITSTAALSASTNPRPKKRKNHWMHRSGGGELSLEIIDWSLSGGAAARTNLVVMPSSCQTCAPARQARTGAIA